MGKSARFCNELELSLHGCYLFSSGVAEVRCIRQLTPNAHCAAFQAGEHYRNGRVLPSFLNLVLTWSQLVLSLCRPCGRQSKIGVTQNRGLHKPQRAVIHIQSTINPQSSLPCRRPECKAKEIIVNISRCLWRDPLPASLRLSAQLQKKVVLADLH